jgi:hypothetical protein
MLLTVLFSNKQHLAPQAADAACETRPKLEVDRDTVQLLSGQPHQLTRHLIRSALVHTAASTENESGETWIGTEMTQRSQPRPAAERIANQRKTMISTFDSPW